jgi:hypothetical protein
MKSNTPGFPLTLFGRHNVEPHGAPILGDSPLARGDAGHVDGRLRLKPGEYVLRLRLGQLPEGAAVLVDLGMTEFGSRFRASLAAFCAAAAT